MEEAGLVSAARRLNVPWLVFRGISDFGDEFKNDAFHRFASKTAAAVLVDFIVHGIDVVHRGLLLDGKRRRWPPRTGARRPGTSSGTTYVSRATILQQQVVASIQNERMTVLLGDSGSGKSALLKAIQRSGGFPAVTLCLPALEAAALVASYHLDQVVKAKRSPERMLLVIDGLDRATSSEELGASRAS